MVGWFSAALIGAYRSSLFHSVICSLGGPLLHRSPVVVFFDRGHPLFWNFYSTIPVDVVRVKSYMNCLFDPTCAVMRVMINKLYFVPESACSVRCCGRALKHLVVVRNGEVVRTHLCFLKMGSSSRLIMRSEMTRL